MHVCEFCLYLAQVEREQFSWPYLLTKIFIYGSVFSTNIV